MLVSCISIRLVGTSSLRCLFHLVVFFPSSKTVSLRFLFCFHVDSNSATAHASNERHLSASRDTLHADRNNRTVPVASTRVARNAAFVQLQNCLVTMLSFFFFKQKTAYEISACLVGSEMCIRDRCLTNRRNSACSHAC